MAKARFNPIDPEFDWIPLFDPTIGEVVSFNGKRVFLKSPATEDYSYEINDTTKIIINKQQITMNELKVFLNTWIGRVKLNCHFVWGNPDSVIPTEAEFLFTKD